MDRRTQAALLLVFLLATLGARIAWAGSPDSPDLSWQVLSGGGAPAVSGSGRVALVGSLGQTAIGLGTGGGSALGAGYWYLTGGGGYPVHLPLVMRNH